MRNQRMHYGISYKFKFVYRYWTLMTHAVTRIQIWIDQLKIKLVYKELSDCSVKELFLFVKAPINLFDYAAGKLLEIIFL